MDVSLQTPLPLPPGDGWLRAVPVGFDLTELLLQVGVPVILDIVVCSLREIRGNGCPSAWSNITKQLNFKSGQYKRLSAYCSTYCLEELGGGL